MCDLEVGSGRFRDVCVRVQVRCAMCMFPGRAGFERSVWAGKWMSSVAEGWRGVLVAAVIGAGRAGWASPPVMSGDSALDREEDRRKPRFEKILASKLGM